LFRLDHTLSIFIDNFEAYPKSLSIVKMFFYLFLCRKDKYFRFQIRSNGCKIVKICKIPPQNMRGAKPLNFPTAPLQLLYHLTSCRPLNSSSRSRAAPLEHLFGQLHTYLLHRKSSRLPKHKTHCPKSRFCFLAVQVDPFPPSPGDLARRL
jgi:hypothetical protein